jgi:anti-sigma regulatory factor (Ser/Thr protein kinase)
VHIVTVNRAPKSRTNYHKIANFINKFLAILPANQLESNSEVDSVIAIPIPWHRGKWSTISFASTLYLCPILDLLLVNIPPEWRSEVRLGLQEALVNAAKHGNKLDPSKTIIVQFKITATEYSWVISDEGTGFIPYCECHETFSEHLPSEDSENGRGFCILHEIFDRVYWNQEGTQLRLSKLVKTSKNKQPLLC